MWGTTILPAPFHCPIPYKDGVYPGSILLPHEMFAAYFSGVDFWKKTFCQVRNSFQNGG
jgi:hypothetical protein